MSKDTITVRVEPDVRKALDSLSTALDRDRSYVINEALAAYIDLHQWQVQHMASAPDGLPDKRFLAGGSSRTCGSRQPRQPRL